jgi:Flp pilus assembly protein TadD
VLEIHPEHPQALHYAGVLAHQQGRNVEAVALVERSLALDPGRATGSATRASSSSPAASSIERIDAYRRAIAIDATHANAHSNLGVLLRATGQTAEAEAAYRTAIQLNPITSTPIPTWASCSAR